MNWRPDSRSSTLTVMAKLATLGQVVEYMNEQLGGGASASPRPPLPRWTKTLPVVEEPPSGTPTAGHGALGLGRYVLEAVPHSRAIGMAQNGLFGGGPILVTVVRDDATGLAEHVATALETRGVAAQAVTEIPSGDIRGVIFLGGLREVSDDIEATRVNREAFEVARAVASAIRGEGSRRSGVFVTVQDTGGAFGTSDFEAPRAWLAGCAGLARTVAQEWPGDFRQGDRSRASRAQRGADRCRDRAEELVFGGPDLDVGLDASGRRVVLRSRGVGSRARKAPVLKDGDVVVASGGARGVTATTMIELAGEARLRFVLLGRTQLEVEPTCCKAIEGDAALKRELLARAVSLGEKLTPAELGRQASGILAAREVRATLAAIEQAGSQARYMAVDVTSLESVSDALKRGACRLGRHRGDRTRRRSHRGQASRREDHRAVRSRLRHEGGGIAHALGRHRIGSDHAALLLLLGCGPLRQPRTSRLRDGERDPEQGRSRGVAAPRPYMSREVARLGPLGGRHGEPPAEGALRIDGRAADPARSRCDDAGR